MKEAVLYNRRGNKLICTACKWYCQIPKDFVGICSVRLNKNNKLYLLTHSLVSSYNTDPIEKKPLYHFLPGSGIFSIGTYGCNFGCDFCQNWEISQGPKHLKEDLVKKGYVYKLPSYLERFIEKNSYKLTPETIVDTCIKDNIPSIAFTYNEPTIFAEYAYDTMKLAKKRGIYGVFVSSGYESMETLDLLDDYIDGYNIDIKGGSEKFYRKFSHTSLKIVLETVEELVLRKKWLEVTTLLIPGLNTDKKDLKFIANFLYKLSPDIPWHVTSFYPHYKMTHIPPTSYEELKRAYEIGKEVGLKYVYTGNITNQDTESTYCPKCQTLLIKRQGYAVDILNLDEKKGRCKKCKEKIPGVWN